MKWELWFSGHFMESKDIRVSRIIMSYFISALLFLFWLFFFSNYLTHFIIFREFLGREDWALEIVFHLKKKTQCSKYTLKTGSVNIGIIQRWICFENIHFLIFYLLGHCLILSVNVGRLQRVEMRKKYSAHWNGTLYDRVIDFHYL